MMFKWTVTATMFAVSLGSIASAQERDRQRDAAGQDTLQDARRTVLRMRRARRRGINVFRARQVQRRVRRVERQTSRDAFVKRVRGRQGRERIGVQSGAARARVARSRTSLRHPIHARDARHERLGRQRGLFLRVRGDGRGYQLPPALTVAGLAFSRRTRQLAREIFSAPLAWGRGFTALFWETVRIPLPLVAGIP